MTNSFQDCSNCSKYGGLDFNRLRSGPFEGPAIVIPPALPEDTYCYTRAAQFQGLSAESSYRLQKVGGNILGMLK